MKHQGIHSPVESSLVECIVMKLIECFVLYNIDKSLFFHLCCASSFEIGAFRFGPDQNLPLLANLHSYSSEKPETFQHTNE